MSRTSGGRGLILVLFVLVVLAALMDLMSPGSIIRGALNRPSRAHTPAERAVKEFTEERQTPIPQSNRVEGGDPRAFIPATRPRIPG